MNKTFKFQHSILLFFGYAAYLLLENPLNLILEKFSLPVLYQGYLSNLILLLPLLLFLVFLLYNLNLEKYLTTKDKRIFLIPAVYLLYIIAANFKEFENTFSLEFFIFLFGLCLVGFTEEFLFRGILFTKLTTPFSSVYIGAIMSSFLFGIGHYINLIHSPDFINEITFQVIYAFCIGILMCGIFYRTKNLFIPSLIHTILNLQAQIRTFNAIRNKQTPIMKKQEVFHPSLGEILSQELMFSLFCLIVGFILIYYQHKKDNNKITIGNS
ncbi:CPBP family intramembrane glutamic endopeptidase [Sinomicrobium sp. M5D2P17]